MSLTSYRTAPPRVTDHASIRYAGAPRADPDLWPESLRPETTSRPYPAYVDEVHINRPSRVPHPGGCRS